MRDEDQVEEMGEIMGMFMAQREVRRKGKDILILLLRSLGPYKICNKLLLQGEAPRHFFFLSFVSMP